MEAVVAAGIAAIPATLASLAAWRSSKSVNSVVQGNGKGRVDQMLEQVLDHLETQDGRIAKQEDWANRHRLVHLRRN